MYDAVIALLAMGIAASLALVRNQRFAIWVFVAGLVMFCHPYIVFIFSVCFGWCFTYPGYQIWYVGLAVTLASVVGLATKLFRRLTG
jgi:high-affinity nickel permease